LKTEEEKNESVASALLVMERAFTAFAVSKKEKKNRKKAGEFRTAKRRGSAALSIQQGRTNFS